MQEFKNTAHLGTTYVMCTAETLVLVDTPPNIKFWKKRMHLCSFDQA
jgi:hypothetical protein